MGTLNVSVGKRSKKNPIGAISSLNDFNFTTGDDLKKIIIRRR
jgi:hypothetical protein